VGVVLQPLAQSLALSGEAVAALMGAAGLSGVVLGLAGAGLIGTLGAGRVLLGSLGFAAALSPAQTLMPDYSLFCMLRLIEGITNLFIVIAAPSLIVQQAPPRHLAVALGLWSTFCGVAFALAAALVLLYPEGLAVQGLFLTHAVACMGLVFGLGRRIPARGGTRTDWRAVRAAVTPTAHALAYSHLRIVLPGAIFLFHAAASAGVVVFLPQLAPTDPIAKALAVVVPVATFCGTLLSGFMARARTCNAVIRIATGASKHLKLQLPRHRFSFLSDLPFTYSPGGA
jgi:predicted MFS family arabinose efflux permease